MIITFDCLCQWCFPLCGHQLIQNHTHTKHMHTNTHTHTKATKWKVHTTVCNYTHTHTHTQRETVIKHENLYRSAWILSKYLYFMTVPLTMTIFINDYTDKKETLCKFRMNSTKYPKQQWKYYFNNQQHVTYFGTTWFNLKC